MITGVVESDEVRIRVTVKGPRGREREVEAVVDTGYTGSLTLPPSVVSDLGMRWRGADRGTMADGSDRVLDVYTGEVVWDGAVRRVLVYAIDTEPLVGMELLRGYELKIQVRRRGKVTIKRLPRRDT